MKPICVKCCCFYKPKCCCFYKPKKNGIYFLEGMPIDPDARPGKVG